MIATLFSLTLFASPLAIPSATPGVEAKNPAPKNTDQTDLAPPGMVSFKGGRTKIGVTIKDVQKMLDENPELLPNVNSLDSETPQFSTSVKPFNLMVTEVTNEQYREFVKATGYRPAQLWGAEVIEAGRTAFFADKDNRGKTFHRKEFWHDNWEGASFALKQEDLLSPVVFVDYSDALAYCDWAGLRLPTEEEFQHACRLKGDDPYPWGTDVEATKFATTKEFRGINGPMPAGWVPAGKTSTGVYDLIGNAWEWTTSPYVGYKGWKSRIYKVGTGKTKDEKKSFPIWNGDRRVCAGGSWELPLLAARATIRRGTERDQQTLGIGFRAASSLNPAADKAASVYTAKVRLSTARADGATFDTDKSIGWVRWTSRETELTEKDTTLIVREHRRMKPEVKSYVVPDGYQVITGFQHITFTPNALLETSNDKDLQRRSLGDPVQLGYLSFDQDMLSPELIAGTYIVAYRHGGDIPAPKEEEGDKDKKKKGEEEEIIPPPDWAGMIDLKKENLLFLDVETGETAAFVEVSSYPKVESDKKLPPAKMIATTKKTRSKDAEGKPIFIQVPWLEFTTNIPAANNKGVPIKGRSWNYVFEIKPPEGFVELDWRR